SNISFSLYNAELT
ncbi:hypothetical protein D018_2993B, partial [Vibrio parahaemolyticus VP2007-007]